MRYVFDHDLHIHSYLSTCSGNPLQNPQSILEYAKRYKLKTICLTDHLWDSTVKGASDWYKPQNIAHISESKPLPQTDEIRFLFGCETELDKNLTLGLAKENFDLFDFIIIPTTHMHMEGFTVSDEDIESIEKRGKTWLKRFYAVLSMDLPFHKIGIPHLTTSLIARKNKYGEMAYIDVLNSISDKEMEEVFSEAAEKGVGIELNADDFEFSPDEKEGVLRPYIIAKEKGCKFYLGSDAHGPKLFDRVGGIFENAIDYLNLTENDKFHIGK